MTTTNRVFKTSKVIKISFAGITSDQLLTDAAGNNKWDISDVNWDRIVVEYNVTTLTGTSVTFKMLTTNDPNGGATTDTQADKADGSTDMASATLTGTGRGMFATGKMAADGSAASNIGKYIEILADVTSLTALVGDIFIYVEGK